MDYRGPINPKNPPADGEAGISIYLYRPWMGGAIAGVVTFGIAMCIQLWYMRKRGTRWIHGLLALGCVSYEVERAALPCLHAGRGGSWGAWLAADISLWRLAGTRPASRDMRTCSSCLCLLHSTSSSLL